MLVDFCKKKLMMILPSLTLIILTFSPICGTVTTAFIIRTPFEPTSISTITKVPGEHPFLTTSAIIQRYMNPPASNNFMERVTGEDDDSYFKRIMNIASNPESFEKAVLQQKMNASTLSSSSGSELNENTNSTNSNSNNATDIAKPKYVRGEEWDAEERRKASSGSWEERVQYDGQLYGNRYQQNEILRKNLKGF